MREAAALEANTLQLGDCFLWTGGTTAARPSHRYGHFRGQRAHRVAYEIANGPIPEGLTIDHLCRQPLCVNPFHLEATSNRENVLRGRGITARNIRKTHCIRGHELKPENLKADKLGQRHCRLCFNARRTAKRLGIDLGLSQ